MSSDFYKNSILPFAGIIIKICRAYSSSQEDYEDYFQEVCLQIWRTRHNFKSNSEWSTWIYRISLNVCLTLKKKADKRVDSTTTSTIVDQHEASQTNSFRDQSLNQLYDAIKQLPEIDRAIILLYLEKKSHLEIGEIIGTNANNIGVKINRIKKKLGQIIAKSNG